MGALLDPATNEPVRAAVAHLGASIREGGRAHEVQYLALRDCVEDLARGEDAKAYGLLLAVHDALLREKGFRPPGGDAASLTFFDEGYYLEMNPDIAGAVEAGGLSDGFAHFASNGAAEGRRPHPWRASPRLSPSYDWQPARDVPEPSPAVEPVAPSRSRIREALGRLFDSKGEAGVRPETIPRAERFGVNLIGFHSANLGLGVSIRAYRRLLLEAGLDVCPVELPVPDGRSGHDNSYAEQFLPLDVEAPFAVNVFIMNATDLEYHLAQRYPAVRTEGKINAALLFWELPRLPRTWIPVLNEMDIAIAPSEFIRHAMMMDLDRPIIRYLPHPLYMPEDLVVDRERWELPEDQVVFVCSFEMASDIRRKNPFVGIEAFQQAHGDDGRAQLIVKVNNSKGAFGDHLERLREIASRHTNIRLLEEVMSYRDVMTLFASCDVLISLHRAEGLGLCLMEAMTLGRPVLATAFSGNMEFTTEQNSCLVGYDLIPVQNATQPAYAGDVIGEDARWADARVDEAAAWMRRLVAEPGLRRRIGARAAADLRQFQSQIDVAEFVTSVQNLASRRSIELR